MNTAASNLLIRIRRAWSVLRCQGGPISRKVLEPALDGQAAGGIDIRILDEIPPIGWQCSNRLESCGTCPRFQAYRQGLMARKHGTGDLHVQSGSDQVESNMGHCDRKAAEIEHLKHQQFGAIVTLPAGHSYAHPNPVQTPVSPGVNEAESRAKQGNAERDCLDEILIHGAPKHSSGSAH